GAGQRPTWLLAYRATDGQQVWNVTRLDDMSDDVVKASDGYGMRLYASPGIIVVALVTRPPYAPIWAFRSSDGQLLRTNTDSMAANSSLISVSDVSADIIVGESDGDATTVVALDAQTGELLWSDPGSKPHGAQSLDSAAIVAGVVFASRGPSAEPGPPTVTAYDAASGHVMWERTYQSRYAGMLLASKDAIYTLELEGVTARRPSDGSILWVDHSSALADARVYPSGYAAGNRILTEGTNGIPLLVGSAIYVNVAKSRNSLLGFTTYVQNDLYAVDQHSGKLYWAIALGPEHVIRD
ncbi:MAG TPA: PQQ-binding-like beta-propeller repeat protein, partial [Ktedonobacterales bacterium]|nr:PQQ-binding-like beta-propeller repeat protein [Ktedonobacterales bacterium]